MCFIELLSYIGVLQHINRERGREGGRRTENEREEERMMYNKELVHSVREAGKSKICRIDW